MVTTRARHHNQWIVLHARNGSGSFLLHRSFFNDDIVEYLSGNGTATVVSDNLSFIASSMANTSSVPFTLRNELISILVDESFPVNQRWRHMIIHIFSFLWQEQFPNTRCICGRSILTSLFGEFNHFIFTIDVIYNRAYLYVQHEIPRIVADVEIKKE